MKFLKWTLIVLAVLVAGVVGAGFVLPDSAHVERATVLKARPATVYLLLNGFRQFNRWSPWAEKDPNATYMVEGPMMGVGAKQSWQSNDPDVGSGSQEIFETRQNELIKERLIFSDFESDNVATYQLTAEGEGTRLVWSFDMACNGNIMCRYFGLLMDSMLGPDYEKGLTKLSGLVETLPKEDFSDLTLELVETQPVDIVLIPGEATADQSGAKLGELYQKLLAHITANGSKQTDAPMAITESFDEASKLWKFEAAIPVDRADLPADDAQGIRAGKTYTGQALKVVYKGAYAAMEPTYKKLEAYRTVAGYEDNGKSWEHYVSDPGNTPEADLQTNIYWPVR